MFQADSFDALGGDLLVTLAPRKSVTILGYTVSEHDDPNRWLIVSGGAPKIDVRSCIVAALTEDESMALLPTVARIYITPVWGCGLILNGDISPVHAHKASLVDDETGILLGSLLIASHKIEVVVMTATNLDKKFNLKGTIIVSTDANGAIVR